jgi:putative flippase GtrA
VKFAAVGGAATALHYAVAAALSLSGLAPVVMASTIGFLLSALANYLLNARFTFGAQAANAGQGGRFALTVASGCALNAALLHVGVQLGISAVLAQLGATAAVMFWNFTLSSLWVFQARS